MKSLCSFPTIVPNRRHKTRSQTALMKPSFADLPTVLLEIIMSQLVLKDNIRASAACKSWLEAAVSVRVVEKHPWILYFPKHGHLFKLCDPLTWKSNPLKLPELAGSTVCYSRDGWLLMHRCESQDTFFFNPFSKELISLPKIDLSFREIAFSCSPTSDDCVVVAIHFAVSISTCCPGATEWFTKHHIIFPPFQTQSRPFHKQSTLLYVDDQFYGFNEAIGCLYSFYPYSRRLYVHSSACIDRYQQSSGCQKTVFLGEKKGELFLICTSGNEKPLVFFVPPLLNVRPKPAVPCKYRKICFNAVPCDFFGSCMYRLATPTENARSGLV
ncbi:hypothetical protein EUTSA_v10029466mg [Eutrema salsugineum]|uniref:Uncharacterized protein n=1 Tax=Eutrema salsugineum TaxID=72664 RepID=V4N019_EUTSA|nr:hypothetical protein EUTSA_v10029466mg [Eutrema salsugineum]